MSTEAEQHAAMTAWLAEHSRPWHNTGWNARAEERMAAAANDIPLRDVPEHGSLRHGGRRERRDGNGYISRDGGYSWAPDYSEDGAA